MRFASTWDKADWIERQIDQLAVLIDAAIQRRYVSLINLNSSDCVKFIEARERERMQAIAEIYDALFRARELHKRWDAYLRPEWLKKRIAANKKRGTSKENG